MHKTPVTVRLRRPARLPPPHPPCAQATLLWQHTFNKQGGGYADRIVCSYFEYTYQKANSYNTTWNGRTPLGPSCGQGGKTEKQRQKFRDLAGGIVLCKWREIGTDWEIRCPSWGSKMVVVDEIKVE